MADVESGTTRRLPTAADKQRSERRRKILLVEDDPSIMATLKYNLVREGYDMLVASDGAEALTLARSRTPDLIVLDLMLPIMSGTEVCRSLRADGDTVPILMLTARDHEIDRVVGLEIGADDYMVKPFSIREVIAKVAAMLRRVDMLVSEPFDQTSERLEAGDLVIDLAGREVTREGEVIHLRPKEYDLVAFLAQHPGRAYSRDQLLQHVWGYDYAGDTRTVDVHVRWLRQKIEDEPSDPKLVLTVRGMGYRFAPQK
jgi:DNA-binding response OmpR family regulator